jgi:phosphate starvation-inducible PhoH-like protein
MPVVTLEFETPQFLLSLIGGDMSRLKLLEQRASVKITSRDGWVKIDGPDDAAIEKTAAVINQLESACRAGTPIDSHFFRVAAESVFGPAGQSGPVSANAPALKELTSVRLLGSSRKPGINPKTKGQLDYIRAIEKHDVTFGIGPAGTGKTFLAVATAIAAFKAKQISRIILSRPAVEAGEALGFLPGDMNEKIFPYLRPLYDALYDMVEPDELEKMIERGQIEIAPLAYMRGRTLSHAFIILDEAQNTTTSQMLMFLTRLGEDSKCVVTGDPTQVDLRQPGGSGLAEAARILPGTAGVAFVQFSETDVVRHPVVARIINAYDKARKKESGTWSPSGGRRPRTETAAITPEETEQLPI